ncbi:PREDICTED: low density lipoprotein receptor adapter protein 1 isoform X2 [Myotis davidii]|uniref:low density lipoprotein receptor adapter protein 1 isoform X2 n=1 Tax=Myotis davidii TaxID=225400 RepID=UPI000766EA69|nr:PREDICTED: low density lipoprotein receptor adapter protein 1 isoform X2 [Myotis davidii]
MLFNLKYLGMTLVEQPKGEEMSAAAVKRIVATAKASGKKLQKVTLKVSPRGIILTDGITSQLIENVSIYRISYCTADKMHGKVFAYIAQSQHNENLECHAFLCTKRKMAQAVTLTVAQAFKVAFEFWQVSKEVVATGNLLDLEEMAKAPLSTVSANTTNVDEAPRPPALSNSSVVWELDDDLDEAFSRSFLPEPGGSPWPWWWEWPVWLLLLLPSLLHWLTASPSFEENLPFAFSRLPKNHVPFIKNFKNQQSIKLEMIASHHPTAQTVGLNPIHTHFCFLALMSSTYLHLGP